MFAKLHIKLFIIFVFIFPLRGKIQAQDTIVKKDSIKISVDTLKRKTSSDALKSKVEYTCTDSMIFNISEQKVYLYKNAEIKYENITLIAAYVEINFKENTVFAKGLLDSLGKEYGTPVFTEGEQKFRSKEMTYNYKSKKGLIKEVITQEGEGFLHGTKIKKLPNDEILIEKGLYTTCDLDHPHYQIQFRKGKVYPNDKIVMGPADLIVGDVPTPLMIPFGIFPNKKGRSSGIVIPAYGESSSKGFYIQEGGYYLGLSDMVDTKFTGNIYSKGSWGLRNVTRYKKIYKYNGDFLLDYLIDKNGDFGDPDYSRTKNFKLIWNHSQDPKARPNSSFSAYVNIQTNKFDKRSLTSSTQAYLSNDMSSVIKYATNNDKYYFQTNLSHYQNNKTHELKFDLPDISFGINTFSPFSRKIQTGQPKWYEKINVGYTTNLKNSITTFDTIKLNTLKLQQFKNGMNHSIPISYSMKVLKYCNLTNSINYNERWYLNTVEKSWLYDPLTNTGQVITDTINGFKTERDFNFSSTLTTKLYGLYRFKNFYINAIRHVITPSVSFSYNPDFSKQKWGYFKYYVGGFDNSDKPILTKYSIFENGEMGQPPANKSGSINFSISNNLEMKIRSKKDTISGYKKIVLIDNLTFRTNYDLAKDSLRWSPFVISGRTKLFKVLDVSYTSAWDPYIIESVWDPISKDTIGVRCNKFEYTTNHRLFRHTSTYWAFNINYTLSPNTFKKKSTEKTDTKETDLYSVPWSFNFFYMLNSNDDYSYPTFRKKNTIVQTLSFNGDISLTPKWKIGFNSGYDIVGKKLAYTEVHLNRDLHCWEMVLNWTPFGDRKHYDLTIRVKASVLQDLKLEKKSDNSYTY